MDLFSSQPGVVVAVPSPGIPMSMFLQNWNGYAPFKSTINGFEFDATGGIQFMHSLRDFIYVYTFGERISQLTIHGHSFAHVAERFDEQTPPDPRALPLGQTTFVPNFHGLEYVLGYYNVNRATATGAPVTVVLGVNAVLLGFLTDVKIGLQDAEKRMTSWSLNFKSIPQSTLLNLGR